MIEKPSVLGTEDEEINLTPLLDCIFILIFFFLVATTLREEEAQLEVQLPRAPIEGSAQTPTANEIVINAEGQILVDGAVVETENLESVLAQYANMPSGERLMVASDADAPMQAFVDVVATLSRLGITFTDLRTRPSETDIQP